MIGIIQVVNHIPLMNINVPSNAINFYKMVIPIVNYDLLSNFDFYEDFLIRISRTATTQTEKPGHGRILEELPEGDEIPFQT